MTAAASDEGITQRERIFARDEYRCVYCALSFPAEQLTLDHVQPKLRGGDDSPGNLVTACRACNTRKGSAPAWAYLADRPQEREMFLRHATAVWPRLRRAIEEAARRERPR
jgi:5-methylcytosine-specific restriction endonuclease McrA